jgi:hypothetical protein
LFDEQAGDIEDEAVKGGSQGVIIQVKIDIRKSYCIAWQA